MTSTIRACRKAIRSVVTSCIGLRGREPVAEREGGKNLSTARRDGFEFSIPFLTRVVAARAIDEHASRSGSFRGFPLSFG